MRSAIFALSACVLCATALAEEAQDGPKPLVLGIEELHPTLESDGGNVQLELKGFLQFDGRTVAVERGTAREFLVRRARAKIEGELWKLLEFEVDVDLSEDDEPLRDAYVNAVFRESFQVRAGKGKLPFSQEELRSSRFLDFGERSPINNLIPDRSLGVEVHGLLEEGKVEYQTGVFGVAAATSGGHEVFGRLKLRPFAEPLLEKLSFGGSLGRGSLREGESFRGRAGSRSFTFFEPIPISGRVSHDNAEAAWFYGSFALNAEWIRTRFERRSVPGTPDIVGDGFTLGGAWILTGEEKGERGIAPRRSVFSGGFGAWEIVARYEELHIDGGVDDREVHAVVLGANWWPSAALRFVANFSWDRFENPASEAPEGAFAVLTRVQVIF